MNETLISVTNELVYVIENEENFKKQQQINSSLAINILSSHSTSASTSPSPSPCSSPSCTTICFINNLAVEVFTTKILTYCGKESLCNISLTNKRQRYIVMGKNSKEAWESIPIHVCIDSYCICSQQQRRMFKTKYKNNHDDIISLSNFLRICPIRTLSIHCFVSDIPTCIMSLAEMKTLRHLELKLTNKSDSIGLKELLVSTFGDYNSYSNSYNNCYDNNISSNRKLFPELKVPFCAYFNFLVLIIMNN